MIDNYMNRSIKEVEKPCFYCDGTGLTDDAEECPQCKGEGVVIILE